MKQWAYVCRECKTRVYPKPDRDIPNKGFSVQVHKFNRDRGTEKYMQRYYCSKACMSKGLGFEAEILSVQTGPDVA